MNIISRFKDVTSRQHDDEAKAKHSHVTLPTRADSFENSDDVTRKKVIEGEMEDRLKETRGY